MKDRIMQIMQKTGLSNAEFAEKIGISTSSLSHILTERNKPSLDVVMRIHKAYPNININWLLYGENTMEKVFPQPENVDLFSQLPSDVNDGNAPSAYKENKEGYLVKKMEYRSKEMPREEIKYIEKPQPKITEIRIFFDNGTFQIFKPDKE